VFPKVSCAATCTVASVLPAVVATGCTTNPSREALAGVPRVAVLDRNISPGHSGIFAEEIRAALYDVPVEKRPAIHGYIVGLGGRDVTPATILDCVARTRGAAKPQAEPEREDVWVGVKS
jgi:pyruvate/2-oxoacid:ferredoxin oxidoreductase alpha subunit